ncbi:DNA repair protein RecO [bacterium CG10_46_32]|nr:MAG: DNA repair protein RecO [bacterium CG10_46_32]PIR56563.1 MAG: DNA repair protein RecO [Parcubacteria group bacterium CG10_big_fil_rev_8_21_14_0_10_46_32]
MATYKIKAIVLSSYPYREHDRIITFFSDAFGKIEARARGVRKIESKLAGHLEPFIKTDLLLANGRRWDILAGSRTRDPRSIIRSDMVKSAAASVCVEAVKRATRPFSREYGLYQGLDRVLFQLEHAHKNGEESEIMSRFVWDLISQMGFAPELGRCIHCKSPVSSGAFSCEGGGMLCEACAPADVFADSVDGALLAQLASEEYALDAHAQTIVKRFWNHVFEYPIISWDFFQTVAI